MSDSGLTFAIFLLTAFMFYLGVGQTRERHDNPRYCEVTINGVTYSDLNDNYIDEDGYDHTITFSVDGVRVVGTNYTKSCGLREPKRK